MARSRRLFLALALALPWAACAPSARSGAPGDAAASDAPATDDAAPDAAVDGPASIDPAPLLEALGPSLEQATGGEVALAVLDLGTDAGASYHGDVLHISASSAKAFWVAAATGGVGVAPVEPYAAPVFADSDNYAAGDVIDLIGPDAVNVFLWDVAGMNDTALTSWSFGKVRVATNSPRRLGGDNYFTADDSIRFLAGLWRGELLDPEESAALLDWMLLSPRQGYGGWAGDGLPEAARAAVHHKAGWLPPGCCSMPYHTLVDIGIVETESEAESEAGGAYAYALLFRYGDWDAEQAQMARAACEIHALFTATPADC